MDQIVVAAFDSIDDARNAIERLSDAGIGPKRVYLDSPQVRSRVAELMRC